MGLFAFLESFYKEEWQGVRLYKQRHRSGIRELYEADSQDSTGSLPRPRSSRRTLKRKSRKDMGSMIFRNDAHGVLFEKEIRLHKGSAHSLATPTKKITAALFMRKREARRLLTC